MTEWKEYKLGDVAKIQTGPFGSQLHASDYVATGIPSIMPFNIGNRLNIEIEKIASIKESDAIRLQRYLVQEGDVIYSRGGDVEKCAFITYRQSGWLCGTGYLRIRFDQKKVFPRYCAYYLSTDEKRGWISGHAVGTTMPNLNSTILENVPIILPPLPEQRAIASVLSSLDDKIDLLHRQNKTLEAMAETLFKQWFVEEADVQVEEVLISSVMDFNPTRTLAKGTIAPYLEMSNVSTSVFHPDSWYDREYSSGMKFINGDTLLACITPCLENGKSTYVTFLEENQVGWGSTEFIILRPKDGFHPLLAYALIKNQDFRDYAEGCLEGSSGRQRVNIDHLKDYSIFMPQINRIKTFNESMMSIEPRLDYNFKQIRTLLNLRDSLLPKLMSGEVRLT